MSRWICIDELDYDTDWDSYADGFTAYSQLAIDTAPSIDLVTCAECRHCTHDIVVERSADGYERTVNLCRHPKHIEEWSVPKDWYCADGQRRENDGMLRVGCP